MKSRSEVDLDIQAERADPKKSSDSNPADPIHIGSLLLRLIELEREREVLLAMMEDDGIVSIRLTLSGRMPVR